MEKRKEIDIFVLVKKILKEWRVLSYFALIFAIIGVIVALNTPREYTAQTILAPEMSAGGSLGLSSNLADMASTFGINIDKKSSVDAIYPELYPDIFASTDFILPLYDVKIRTKDNDSIRTYYYHITEEWKTPFWEEAKEWLIETLKKPESEDEKGNKDPYKISRTNAKICESISNSISCLVDKKTSEITISYTDQDPLTATIIVDTLQRRLQEYITNYRTQKARINYEYYKKLAVQMQVEFEQSRDKYVEFADANQEVQLQSYIQKTEEMENDMQIKYDSYKSVLNSMRQAKAKIQEATPAFTTIQSPIMPHKPSSRGKIMTVLIYIFIGLVLGVIWILFKKKMLVQNN